MNRPLIGVLLFMWSLLSLTPAVAEEADSKQIGMVTGSKTGTYIQFGNDIAGVAKTVGLDILVKDSQGSIDNIKRINSKENATFGIVQSDVLGFLSRSESPEMRQLAGRLRLIFPFYKALALLQEGEGLLDQFGCTGHDSSLPYLPSKANMAMAATAMMTAVA